MKIINSISLIALIAITFLLGGCDKTKPYDIEVAMPEAHFVGTKTQVYTVENATTPVFNVQVGTTDVASSDRSVTYKVVSPSGAVGGTQYSIASGNTSGTITVRAGEALASIPVQAVYSQYTSGRKDTLIFTLEQPSVKPAGFLDTVKLVLRGPCLEADVNLNDLLGAYTNTTEDFGGPNTTPYTTRITSATLTSPTTGTIVVENVYNDGWAPITYDIDWTDPNNRTVMVATPPQFDIAPATTVTSNPSYATWMVIVSNPSAAQGGVVGTFSICNQTMTLKMRVGIYDPASGSGGYFGELYTVYMER
jgi:hypothetical protein